MKTHLKAALCWGTHSRGKGEMKNQLLLTCHQTQKSKTWYAKQKNQFSPALFSLSTSSSWACPGRRIWLSKSFYSLGNLYNPPAQINTEETRKWPLVSLAPDNTKYLKLEQWELMRKYKSMAEAFPLVIKKNKSFYSVSITYLRLYLQT